MFKSVKCFVDITNQKILLLTLQKISISFITIAKLPPKARPQALTIVLGGGRREMGGETLLDNRALEMVYFKEDWEQKEVRDGCFACIKS